jgi:beta-glucosidase
VYVASLLNWWQWLGLVGFFFFFLHRAIVTIIRRHQESVYWNWDNGGDDVTVKREVINTDVEALTFPPDFLFGVATSAHQIEGGDGGQNQWGAWESDKDKLGQPRIRDGSKVGSGGQHWLRVDEDIKLLKELGVNRSAEYPRGRTFARGFCLQYSRLSIASDAPCIFHCSSVLPLSSYRFSIEWSKIQPQPLEWSQSALQHYSDEIDQLVSQGIVPLITLQHFTIPLWFEALGGFEKEENLRYFVEYAERVFVRFKDRVNLWVTINEPFFYSFNGYMSGVFPPGKTEPALCGIVLRNLLEAHVATYQRLRTLAPASKYPLLKIGLVHSIYFFDQWNPLNGFDHLISRHLNHLFNLAVLNFFATGDYRTCRMQMAG